MPFGCKGGCSREGPPERAIFNGVVFVTGAGEAGLLLRIAGSGRMVVYRQILGSAAFWSDLVPVEELVKDYGDEAAVGVDASAASVEVVMEHTDELLPST